MEFVPLHEVQETLGFDPDDFDRAVDLLGQKGDLDVRWSGRLKVTPRGIERAERHLKEPGAADHASFLSISITAPVGAIQLGSGNTANIVQSIGEVESLELRKLLREIQERLASVENASNDLKGEVRELIDETVKSLDGAQKPSRLKLATIASTIGVLSQFTDLYLKLKPLLAAMGVPLP